ncbi:MAG: HAMP domain-containing histidine kinase [Oscillospiraceae bacterium]|nr:HAMP domain-containing histidine kinase [Oscillospiraceae bacterium]
MKAWYTNTRRKVILAVACIACCFAAILSCLTLICCVYVSPVAANELGRYYNEASELARLQMKERQGQTLTYDETMDLNAYRYDLDPANTNFRVQIWSEDGLQLYSNLTADEDASVFSNSERYPTMSGGDTSYFFFGEHEEDEIITADTGEACLVVKTAEGEQYLSATDYPPGTYNEYGWMTDGERWLQYVREKDTRITYQPVQILYGVADPMTVEDEIYTGTVRAEVLASLTPWAAVVLFAGFGLGIFFLALLCRSAGYRAGREEIALRWWDKIPYDVYWLLTVIACIVLLTLMDALIWALGDTTTAFLGCVPVAALLAMLFVALVVTTAVRVKAKSTFRHTVIGYCVRGAGRVVQTVPMVWRVGILFILYLLISALIVLLTMMTGGGWLVLMALYQATVLVLLCRWALQWKQIRQATGEIIGGNAERRIAAERFFPDLREHAAQLSEMGGAIGAAVEQRMRSERFKAELITNVSHDLKTPLTSIINYVDLLKKEEIENATAREYIAVLDRKSQRLKKLTEDLVEASKASTGVVAVQKERLDMKQLVRQAMGEYEEKLAAGGLTLVAALPEQNVFVQADGRHLWRVLDNLLGNCCKYALPGTRVYLDLTADGGAVVCSIKNISAQPLNIPPEQLLERFVRGDEARTGEGSGLGLSIARSLTELQGGVFSLRIDGDLFQATISLEPFP